MSMSSLLMSYLLATLGISPADAWAGFRGDGTSTTYATRLPLTWSSEENVAWRVALPGYGQSSPVVLGDKVFVTAINGSEKETLIVIAIDARKGALLWKREFQATQKGKNNPAMSRGAPTPLVDLRGVYAFFESGDVIALDHEGQVLWQRALTKDYGPFQNNHGLASSPTQTDSSMIVLVDHGGPSYLLALDKTNGKNLYRTERLSRMSWTSPIVSSIGGRDVVLVSSSGSLTAYDARSGDLIWEVDDLNGNNIPSPVFSEGYLVIGAGENRLKPDLAASQRSNCCLKLSEGEPGYEVVWRGRKAVAHHASPLIHAGHVYIVSKPGVVYCLDLKTGEERYVERLDNPCWATPIGAGDRIYFFGKDGVTTVLQAGPKYKKLATNRLWSDAELQARKEEARKRPENRIPVSFGGSPPGGKGPTPPATLSPAQREAMIAEAVGDVVYGVAAVDGAFYVRTGTELICIRARE
jgi:outer membrane protein assembly factor BamB